MVARQPPPTNFLKRKKGAPKTPGGSFGSNQMQGGRHFHVLPSAPLPCDGRHQNHLRIEMVDFGLVLGTELDC